MRLYLDVETYRLEAFANEKIIAIGVIEDWTPYHPSSTEIWDPPNVIFRFFTEWELGSEDRVVTEFYRYLSGLLDRWERNEIAFINIVGFNILRFDIPLLVQKGVEYGAGSLMNLNSLWFNIPIVDYFQIMLLINEMKFKGLKLAFITEKARIVGVNVPEPYGSGGDVRRWYEGKYYNEIVKHLERDLEIIRIIDLNYKQVLRALY